MPLHDPFGHHSSPKKHEKTPLVEEFLNFFSTSCSYSASSGHTVFFLPNMKSPKVNSGQPSAEWVFTRISIPTPPQKNTAQQQPFRQNNSHHPHVGTNHRCWDTEKEQRTRGNETTAMSSIRSSIFKLLAFFQHLLHQKFVLDKLTSRSIRLKQTLTWHEPWNIGGVLRDPYNSLKILAHLVGWWLVCPITSETHST